MKSGSDGIETEHLESEGLVQTGDENWQHQLKLKDDEMSCLLEKWQIKEREGDSSSLGLPKHRKFRRNQAQI